MKAMIQRDTIDAADTETLFQLVAHDVRAPMTALLGMTELLAMIAGSAERDVLVQQARMAHGAAQQINSLLENLLAWSRLQAGALTPRPAWIDLDEVTQNVVALWQPNAAAKAVSLRVEVVAGLGARVDPVLLEAILRNLVGNALKFTPRGGTVTVTCRRLPMQAEIEVRDTGPGLGAARLQAFAAGQLQDPAVGSDGERGSGLGLSLCRTLAEKIGVTLVLADHAQGGAAATVGIAL
jgi:two-component system, sensor histidine kinase and response regulator